MKAKSAAINISWLLLFVLVVSFVFAWQDHFAKPTPPTHAEIENSEPINPLTEETKELLQGLRTFCEKEGLAPHSLSEIEEYAPSSDLKEKFKLFRVPNHPAIIIKQEEAPGLSLHILFEKRQFRVIFSEQSQVDLFDPEDFKFAETHIYEIQSFPKQRLKAIEWRLRKRLRGNKEEAWREFACYAKVWDQTSFEALCVAMQEKLPSSRWAKLAIPCSDLSSQGGPRHIRFKILTERNPEYYPDYFRAARRFLSKREFVEFSHDTLIKVPAEYRGECYREAAAGAYLAGAFGRVILYSISWKSPDAAVLYLAARLAQGECQPNDYLSLHGQRSRSRLKDCKKLEMAIRNNDSSFRLSEDDLKTEPFFLRPVNFLGFELRDR